MFGLQQKSSTLSPITSSGRNTRVYSLCHYVLLLTLGDVTMIMGWVHSRVELGWVGSKILNRELVWLSQTVILHMPKV